MQPSRRTPLGIQYPWAFIPLPRASDSQSGEQNHPGPGQSYPTSPDVAEACFAYRFASALRSSPPRMVGPGCIRSARSLPRGMAPWFAGRHWLALQRYNRSGRERGLVAAVNSRELFPNLPRFRLFWIACCDESHPDCQFSRGSNTTIEVFLLVACPQPYGS